MKGLPRSMKRAELAAPHAQSIVRRRVKINNQVINVADGAPGWGTVVIGDLPQGNIMLLGAVAYLQFLTADADVIATWDGDWAIGSAPSASNIALATDKADIIPSVAIGAATAKLSPRNRATHAVANTGAVYDNTDGAMELNLNMLVDDASISGAAAFTANGVLMLSFLMLGDD
jgi:hypothetical protein